MTDYLKDELTTKDAQIKAMGEEIDRLRADLARASAEIERLRGQALALMNERDDLRRMAEIAARFSPLGGER